MCYTAAITSKLRQDAYKKFHKVLRELLRRSGMVNVEIHEFEKVRIKATGITGVAVDIHITRRETVFVVESDEKGEENNG